MKYYLTTDGVKPNKQKNIGDLTMLKDVPEFGIAIFSGVSGVANLVHFNMEETHSQYIRVSDLVLCDIHLIDENRVPRVGDWILVNHPIKSKHFGTDHNKPILYLGNGMGSRNVSNSIESVEFDDSDVIGTIVKTSVIDTRTVAMINGEREPVTFSTEELVKICTDGTKYVTL